MRRIPASAAPLPEDRNCSMCDGPAKCLGTFGGGDYWGFGCLDRGCRHSWLVLKDTVVCDNCGDKAPPLSTSAGRFCDTACADAYCLV